MLTAMAISLVVLMLLGFPLWLVFLITSLIAIHFYLPMPPLVAIQTVFSSLSNWLLLALPGFIYAGELLSHSGMALRLTRWIQSAVGGLVGGVPITTVFTAEVFGSMSGSGTATTAALGKVLYPSLREQGYNERFSLGLIASCGTLATVIPPSINMILYASAVKASVGDLFIAGIIPGLFIGVLMAGYIVWYSRRQGMRGGGPPDWRQFLRLTGEAIWPLGVPVLIIGGIYSGIFTPTESAALSAVYAALVGTVILKSLTWRQLMEATLAAAQLTAKIFIIVGSSAVFSWVLTIARVPRMMVDFVQAIDPPAWAVLLILNLIMLIAGMFIDTTSAVVLLSPLLWPIAQQVGLDPVHFGIIVVVNLGIGMFTPPFGLNIFVTSSVLRVPTVEVTRGILPFVTVYLIALLAITFVPGLSLWLPKVIAH